MKKKDNTFLLQDIGIIVLSIIVSIILVKTEIIADVLIKTHGFAFLESFIAGIFFTSVFTTAPAIATIGQIAQTNSLIGTAFFGALGSLMGDLIIFRFFRDRFSDHLTQLLSHGTGMKRLRFLFKLKFFRWFSFFIGGLIIASPLPDELGISLLGFSKTKLSWFIPLSFVLNFIGIYIVCIFARSL